MTDAIRPTGDWPLLLLGPMVRRVTREQVNVFIATSVAVHSASLILSSGRIRHDEQTLANLVGSGSGELRQLGDRLYVGLLRVDLPSGLEDPDDGLLSYDIQLDTVEHGTKTLLTLGLLGGSEDGSGDVLLEYHDKLLFEAPLGYVPGYLPSFRLPPLDIAHLRLAHGSCRKPHGGAEDEPDALAILDAVILESLQPLPRSIELPESNQERPHQLILTGDQIYADDVSAGLLKTLTATSAELLGREELIPAGDTLDGILLEPGWRTRFLQLAGIKDIPADGATDYPASHLLRFGEWCAMYLFAWSDALWPRDDEQAYDLPEPPNLIELDKAQDIVSALERIPGVQIIPPMYTKAVDTLVRMSTYLVEFAAKVNETWEDTREGALGYAATVRYVRRLLANVPTYTMFDDHEITDDWYLNQNVTDRLVGHGASGDWAEVGPRMLRNGLSAYAIFQHWGNAPEDFEDGRLGADLLDLWEGSGASPATLATNGAERGADRLLGIQAAIDGVASIASQRADFDRLRWDYAIAFPVHRLIVLDTRTWRYFPDQPAFELADLEDLTRRPANGDDGSDYLQEAATVWRVAAAQAHSDAMEAWADLIAGCAAVVTAGSIADLRAELDAIGAATLVLVRKLAPNIPERGAFEDRVQEWRDSEVPGLSTLGEGYWSTVNFFDRLSRAQLQIQDEPLRHACSELQSYLEAWASGSYYGVAAAVDGFWRLAGAALFPVFTDTTGVDTSASVEVAIVAIGAEVGTLLAGLGVDGLSEKLLRDGTNRLGAALISKQALAFQLTEPIENTGPDVQATILLSPAPIFGHEMVEIAQRAGVIRSTLQGLPGAEEWDYEAWSVNVPAMNDLVEAARALERCVVLSGDVHYANSSVSDVKLPVQSDTPVTADERAYIRGRYIQLTSSSARNSDGNTRGLGLLDDILWDPDDHLQVIQLDHLKSLLPGSGDPDDPSLAGYYQEEAIEGVKQLGAKAWEVTKDVAYYGIVPGALALKLWQERESVVETATAIAMAPANTAIAWGREAVYKLYAAARTIEDFYDDPLFGIFGEFLYAPDVLRAELANFYNEIGVDPNVAMQVVTSVLHDHRTDRLSSYRAYERFKEKFGEDSDHMAYAQVQELRTVGSANVGLVRFEMQLGVIRAVRHELLWYPMTEPEEAEEEGEATPLPRTDWVGTLHIAAWTDLKADLGKTDG